MLYICRKIGGKTIQVCANDTGKWLNGNREYVSKKKKIIRKKYLLSDHFGKYCVPRDAVFTIIFIGKFRKLVSI